MFRRNSPILISLSLLFMAAACTKQQAPTARASAPAKVRAQEPARAQPSAPAERPATVEIPAGLDASLSRPHRLRQGHWSVKAPLWTAQGLWPSVPANLYGLKSVEKPGAPTWDHKSAAWYASANGSLVRLSPDGGLAVVLDNVQGRDLDLRTGQGAELLVAREPDLSITLRNLDGSGAPRVLLKGAKYFGPRLSPDGGRLLVSESRPEGGHVWLLDLNSGARQDLGPGVSPTWHPDGERIVLARVKHNGEKLTAGDLWEVDLTSGEARCLGRTKALVELDATISPDARSLAFVEGVTGDLYVARYPEAR